MTKALATIADGLDVVIDRIGRITGWCSFAIVLVMAYNVLLRYFFRTGSVAMQELEWHLMAPICMLGLSYAILKDGHVQVDILYGRFPERVQRIIQFISTVLVVWSSSPSCSSCRSPTSCSPTTSARNRLIPAG